MPRLQLQYYALLREEAGRQSETVETAAATPAALYAELAQRHGFRLPASQLRVAVNAAFSDWDRPLRDGDEVVFIPPVAGG
jgi:molybdopterin converting factor subunit 1